jgi:hypothetical protein
MDREKLTVALANSGSDIARTTFRDAGIKFNVGDDVDVNDKILEVFDRLQCAFASYRDKGVEHISSMKRKELVSLLRECNAKQGKNFLEHVFNVVKLMNCFLVFVKEHYR